MLHTLVVYAHLLATCLALGSILASDLRLLTRLRRVDFKLAPPSRSMGVLVAASLAALVLTGAALIVLGLLQRADYLANPKLQAKLVLVAVLVVNAGVLHQSTFPWLARGKRIAPLSARVVLGVALPAAVSLALWLYVAFLGVARPWNFTVSAEHVLVAGAVLVVLAWVATLAVMHVAAHHQHARRASRLAAPTVPARPWAVGGPGTQRVADELLHNMLCDSPGAKSRAAALQHPGATITDDPLLSSCPRDAAMPAYAARAQ